MARNVVLYSNHKVRRLKEMLQARASHEDIKAELGFNSSASIQHWRRKFGIPPYSHWRKRKFTHSVRPDRHYKPVSWDL